MNFRSPMRKISGLGAAQRGSGHWLKQRISAVALIFLVIWLLYSFLQINIIEPYSLSPIEAQLLYINWISSPLNAIMVMLLVVAMFYHGAIGIKVILEDYVHNEFIKMAAVITTNLASFAAASIGVFSVFSMYFKG